MQLFFILLMIPCLSFAGQIDHVASLIRQGNIHQLSGLFAENVEVSILGDENIYSRTQTELILDKFFSENRPISVKTVHKVNSNPNYQFGVLIMNSDKGVYRIAFTLKNIAGSLALIEFRIEAEKVR